MTIAIPKDEFRSLLKQHRLGYRQIAELIGYSESLVQRWMTRGGVPVEYEKTVRDALARLDDDSDRRGDETELQDHRPPLAAYSDHELLTDLARRLRDTQGTRNESATGANDPSDGSADPDTNAGPPSEDDYRAGWGPLDR